MEFYNGLPISGTKQTKVSFKFREAKSNSKKKKFHKIRLDKRVWLDYNGRTEQTNQ